MVKKIIVNKDEIQIPKGTIEDFKRPNHPDFMNSAELRASNFTGQRSNSLTGNYELWILGEVVKEITPFQLSMDGQAINKAVAEHFGLNEVQPDVANLKRFRGIKE